MKKSGKHTQRRFRTILSWLLIFAMCFGEIASPLSAFAADGEEAVSLTEEQDGITEETVSADETEAISETTSENEALPEEESASENDAASENEVASEEEAVSENESVSEDEAVSENESVSEDEAVSENTAVSENESTEDPASPYEYSEEEALALKELSNLLISEDKDEAAESAIEAGEEERLGDTTYEITTTVKYGQTYAREIIVSANMARTASKLDSLTYDYGLEALAMRRAAEIAVYYSNTRPNGESFDSILPSNVRSGSKEVLLADVNDTDKVFATWVSNSKETLFSTSYRYAAIGHCTLNGVHYWAIELTTTTINLNKTNANDTDTSVAMNILNSLISGKTITPDIPESGHNTYESPFFIEYYEYIALPVFAGKIKVNGHGPEKYKDNAITIQNATVSWTLGNKDVAKIDNNKIKGKDKRGDCKLSASTTLCEHTQNFTYYVRIKVHPESVQITSPSANTVLPLDESVQIEYKVLPEDADDTAVTFYSGSNKILKVDSKGLATAVGVGTSSIMVEPRDLYLQKKYPKTYPLQDSVAIEVKFDVNVEIPVSTPGTGPVKKGSQVLLTCGTPDATIRYTTSHTSMNFDAPTTTEGTVYTEPLTITEDTWVRAIAYKDFLVEGSMQTIESEVFFSYFAIEEKDWGDITALDQYYCDNDPENIPDGLWVAGVYDLYYTGKAQKFDSVHVYDGNRMLSVKKDYTFSYKNNKNAGTGKLIFKFKGNYSGTLEKSFTINPADIYDASITVTNGKYNGKELKPSIKVKWGNITLKANKDYTISCDSSLIEEGDYTLTITGKGNYIDETYCTYSIIKNRLNLSKAKVSKIPKQSFLAEGYSDVSQLKDKKGNAYVLSVKVGKTELVAGTDFDTEIIGGGYVGTAILRLSAKSDKVCGTKDITFKIVGADFKKAAVVTNLEPAQYTGSEICPSVVVKDKVTMKILTEGEDYWLSYKNNVKAGTATVYINGFESAGYSGTIKKSFKITKVDINSESFVHIYHDPFAIYQKGGVTPEVSLSFTNDDEVVTLTPGVDYTVKFTNNKKVYNTDLPSSYIKNAPSVIITGKGSFTGSYKSNFYIYARNIADLDGYAPDVVYSNKGGNFKTKPVVTDLNGKKLVAGTDFDASLTNYRYNEDVYVNYDGKKTLRKAGETVNSKDIIPAGATLHVGIYGKGNYTGAIHVIFKVTNQSIAKGKYKIADQFYTGDAITLNKSDIYVTIGGAVLPADGYDIIGYSNNTKVGTASVLIRGKGNYGGYLTVKYKIVQEPAKWYEQILGAWF